MDTYEKFRCPGRSYVPIPLNQVPDIERFDKWLRRDNGDFCCSFCNSMHPEQFLKFCKEVFEDVSYDIRLTWKELSGRWYIHRPGCRESKDGAIKFLKAHLDYWMEGFSPEEKALWQRFITNANKKSKYKQAQIDIINK